MFHLNQSQIQELALARDRKAKDKAKRKDKVRVNPKLLRRLVDSLALVRVLELRIRVMQRKISQQQAELQQEELLLAVVRRGARVLALAVPKASISPHKLQMLAILRFLNPAPSSKPTRQT